LLIDEFIGIPNALVDFGVAVWAGIHGLHLEKFASDLIVTNV
jgi:hypothetical protein